MNYTLIISNYVLINDYEVNKAELPTIQRIIARNWPHTAHHTIVRRHQNGNGFHQQKEELDH